jgi:hypothetical protein
MKKSIFAIAMLVIASSYCLADDVKVGNVAKQDPTLQERAYTPSKDYGFQVGDTIVISKSVTHYLTGEEPSNWVYFVRHTIQQIGGKRFPQGMLIKGIYSWIGPDDAQLVGAAEKTEEAVKRQEQDQAAVRERQEELAKKTPEERQAIAREAERIGAEPLDTENTDQKKEQQAVEQQEQQEVQFAQDSVQQEATNQVAQAAEDTTAADSARYKAIDRFTIGVRGGVASLMQNTINNTEKKFGFDALLDIQYAHYWITKKEHRVGLLLGVSAGYGQGGLRNGVNDTYTRTSPEGEAVLYDVKAEDIKETDRQIQLEVPLMFSLITKKGFFLNLGPRFMMPVYTPYSETLVNPHITAHFSDFDVDVMDELATGKVSELDYNGKSANKFKLNVMLGLELGYEWFFSSGNSLGLGAYANYGVYSMFKQQTQNIGLIDVNPKTVPTKVDVYSATDTYTKSMGYLDAGLKLAYHFNWWKK